MPFAGIPSLYALEKDNDASDLAKYGANGQRAPRPLGYVDPRPKPENDYPPGECSEGIELWIHPELMLDNTDPDVKEVARMWLFGVRAMVWSVSDYRQLSNYQLALFEIARATQLREEYRRKSER